jgi:hypothetical protein
MVRIPPSDNRSTARSHPPKRGALEPLPDSDLLPVQQKRALRFSYRLPESPEVDEDASFQFRHHP